MKFIRFKKGDFIGYGLWEEDKIKIIEGDIFDHYVVTDYYYNISEVDILTPCIPSKIICVGLNYRSHAEEMNMPLPEEPIIF